MRLKVKISFLLIFGFFFTSFQAQDDDEFEKLFKEGYIVTNPNEQVALDTIVIHPKPKFTTRYDRRYYNWFRKKTFKAYPYAVTAKQKLDSLEIEIGNISSSRKRKRHIKKKQKFFEEQFTDDVKKLTRTEGKILIKLIHRLTGKTVNEQVQDKRGKFKAFLYRVSAKLFKINLDLEYHPENIMEDYMIETILQQAFIDDKLENYPSVLPSGKLILPIKEIHIEKKK